MAGGVRRFSIDGLGPDIQNALIIGVIIAKQGLRQFVSKKDGLERGVWNMTMRDSPTDTINVTWWGSAAGALHFSNMFAIGDVVEITSPKVRFVHPGDASCKFRPSVSSPFTLELQEHQSDMIPHIEQDTHLIRELMHIPTKHPSDYLRLSDISCYGQSLRGQTVNLLVVVAQLGAIKTITTRRDSGLGSSTVCRDIVVLDQSARDFRVTVWNEDILHWSDSWQASETVLFLADVRIEMSAFHRAVTASTCSSTVITENPDMPETETLRAYARTVPVQPLALLDHLSNSVIDASKIDNIMSTGQLLDKASKGDVPGGQFGALLYAHVTRFDLDGLERIINYKCMECGSTQDVSDKCRSAGCTNVEDPVPVFNLRLDLTDHRGTVTCRLSGSRAAHLLGCTEDVFLTQDQEWRTALKWRLLLRRCEARVIVLCTKANRPAPLISLITCTIADPQTVSAKLPIY